MSPDALIVLAVTGGALILFITEAVPADIVAIIVLIALGMTGILELNELFSGFGRPVILTLIGIFMLTGALQNTGVTAYVGALLLRMTRSTGSRGLTGLLGVAASLASLAMNTIASVALVAPIGRRVALQRELSPSKLLMPVAFSALLGGMATLFTTSNLLVTEMLTERGLDSFNLFSFIPIGGPITIVGILYIMVASNRMLPERDSTAMDSIQQARKDLANVYRLGQRLHEASLQKSSDAVGKTLTETGLGRDYGITVDTIKRGQNMMTPPDPDETLREGDWLLMQGRQNEVDTASNRLGFSTSEYDGRSGPMLSSEDVEIAEIALAPRSRLIGRTLDEVNFRERYGMNVIGLWRRGRPFRSYLAKRKLKMGDALLVQAKPHHLKAATRDSDFIVLTHVSEIPESPEKARLAVGILGLFLLVIALNLMPVALAALAAGVAVIVTGCVSAEQARASIQWQVLFLVGGMLPLAAALEQTGATQVLVDSMVTVSQGWGPRGLLMLFFVLTVGLSQVTSGQATTLIVAPLAIITAIDNSLSPQAFAITVAIASSTGFLSPVAHPANLLVMGPGGYEFSDYARLGATLVLITALGVYLLVPMVYPF